MDLWLVMNDDGEDELGDVIPCFSEDIWFEILKELPVKMLGKCRCVCKSWRSLIVSPSFMAAHHKNYTQNDANSLLLYRQMSSKIKDYEEYILFDDSVLPLQVCHTSVCPFKMKCTNLRPCSHFVGSVHGLLCFSEGNYPNPIGQIMIWNPLLLKYINLPVSATAINDMDHKTASVLGFGYDCMKNDHRVVKISYSASTIPLVEVYSIQDRTWKIIYADYMIVNSINSVSYSSCFLNGVIYWPTRSPRINRWLVSFNVSEETFDKIELPDALITTMAEMLGVFEYQNRLSISCCDYYYPDEDIMAFCRIWIRKEEALGSYSWCQIVNVRINDCFHIGPVEYLRRNGEILIGFDKQPNGLVSYDPVTGHFSDLDLPQSTITKLTAFTESLVLLDQKTDVYTDDELLRSAGN